MEPSTPTKSSRLFLRLVQTATNSSIGRRYSSVADWEEESGLGGDPEEQACSQESEDADPEAISESVWSRLEDLRVGFEAELNFADSCLAENPTKPRIAMLLANSSELRRVAILHRFAERAYSLRLFNPEEGLRIADDLVTWTQADSSRLVSVIRARALMERGNFLRILGDPDGAYRSFSQAGQEIESKGPGDPLELARYQELLGTLERDCGNYEAAADLLRKALSKVRRWGDQYSLQRILIAAALAYLYNENFEQADQLLDESLRIAEPDSLFLRFAAVNKVLSYLHSRQPHKAYQALLRVRQRLGASWLQGFPEDDQMRVVWLEGQILSALRIDDEAIVLLRKAREFFIQANRGYEVCRLSIELAFSYAAQGRLDDVHRELGFGLPFLSVQKSLHRYAHSAVLLLQQTLREQGRLREEQIRLVVLRLDSIHRAPLKAQPQSPFADLRL
jgi:tetratricopeptide (TPR) repeat protein